MATAVEKDKNVSAKRKRLETMMGHTDLITRVCWSPDGKLICSGSNDKTIRIWASERGKVNEIFSSPYQVITNMSWSPDGNIIAVSSIYETIYLMGAKTGNFQGKLSEHTGWVSSMCWSPDSQFIATTCADLTVRIWLVNKCYLAKSLPGHTSMIRTVVWSSDSKMLASAAVSGRIHLWDAIDRAPLSVLEGHGESTNCLAWSPDNSILASASSDNTIRVWSVKDRKCIKILKTDDNTVSCIEFSSDGSIFATMNEKGTVNLMECKSWEVVEKFEEPCTGKLRGGLAFHPTSPILATIASKNRTIHIWDLEGLVEKTDASLSKFDGNCVATKIVLIGGKGSRSAKGQGTEGKARVSVLSFVDKKLDDKQDEIRKTALWDLSDMSDAKSVYPMHMKGISGVVFLHNASNNAYKFDEVRELDKTLRETCLDDNFGPKKFLIVLTPTPKKIESAKVESLVKELEIENYFVTSNKTWNEIEGFEAAIHKTFDHDSLLKISLPGLLKAVEIFIAKQNEAGTILSNVDDLFNKFVTDNKAFAETKDLRDHFDGCLSYFNMAGTIRCFEHESIVLFKPGLLDGYVSALINKVKSNKEGLGCIEDKEVSVDKIKLSDKIRLNDKEIEEKLFASTIDELLYLKIVNRVSIEKGQLLIFPSQVKYKTPDFDKSVGNDNVIEFSGDVKTKFQVLSVCLAHNGAFQKRDIWRNAATYSSKSGGACGILFNGTGVEQGEVAIFFSKDASPETRQKFEKFIKEHLKGPELVKSAASTESVNAKQTFSCSSCGEVISKRLAGRRLQLGHLKINCPVCDTSITLGGEGKEKVEKPDIELQTSDSGMANLSSGLRDMNDPSLGILRSLDNLSHGTQGQTNAPSKQSVNELAGSYEPTSRERKRNIGSDSLKQKTSKTENNKKNTFKDWAGSEKCTLTIVFTDILGSSVLGNKLGNSEFSKLRQAHFAQARKLLKKYNGYEIKTIGDSVMAAFRTASEVLDFALDFFSNTGDSRVQIRVGIHVGPISIEQNDAFGITVNYAARVESMSKGAEIWLSNEVKTHIDQEGLEHHRDLEWVMKPDCEIKSFEGKHTLWTVAKRQ